MKLFLPPYMISKVRFLIGKLNQDFDIDYIKGIESNDQDAIIDLGYID